MYGHKNRCTPRALWRYIVNRSIGSMYDTIRICVSMYVAYVHQTNGGNPDARHEDEDQGPRAYKLSKRNPDRNLWNSVRTPFERLKRRCSVGSLSVSSPPPSSLLFSPLTSPFSTSTPRGNEVHPLINPSAINRRLIRHRKTYSYIA